MPRPRVQLTTGWRKLDRVFRGIMPGDSIVWQIETIEDYLTFVRPYAAAARRRRQKLVYFRFASHAPLLEDGPRTQRVELNAEEGFKPFITKIHRVISDSGNGAIFLFDCLSQLAPDWNSDRMLGNWFLLTCPLLYDRTALAYFAILRHHHSFHAMRAITTTTQILVDTFRRRDQQFLQPLKVQHRNSATMYMLHIRDGDDFRPITQSALIAETLADAPWSRAEAASQRLGCWSRTFAEAAEVQEAAAHGADRSAETDAYFQRLLRMLISHDEAVLRLARKYFTLKDLLRFRARMIGTGLIGGKTVGMLLARAILRRTDGRWQDLLEPHDSFFVGADVFYTYLVENGCWWMINRVHGAPSGEDLDRVRRRLRAGEFPRYILDQFTDLLEYFGPSPLIVRSSSLLEDNFGNAFAGKYESVFCANRGDCAKRLDDFLCAVRTVYASTMSQDALEYRAGRGLLEKDEQMGLLIQRVSGTAYRHIFYPHAAGVALSFNPYAWSDRIDPDAGVLRLVFGMGTHAVDRVDDDYTRVVALNAPSARPEGNADEIRQYTQHRADVIDMEANQLTSASLEYILEHSEGLPIDIFARRDLGLERRMSAQGRPLAPSASYILTFDKLLLETDFVADMRAMLATLQEAYACPVDVEFTVNFFAEDAYRISLVQCRPLQVTCSGPAAEPPAHIDAADLVFKAAGAVVGPSVATALDWLIYVVPDTYSRLPESDRHDVARVVGELCHCDALSDRRVALLGPGRWGTHMPALGVPVSFADISPVAVICEIVAMHENLTPDVSLGTHFFSELVESEMLYLALFPDTDGNCLNRDFFGQSENKLSHLLPDHGDDWSAVIQVVDARGLAQGGRVYINADTFKQRVVCYRAD